MQSLLLQLRQALRRSGEPRDGAAPHPPQPPSPVTSIRRIYSDKMRRYYETK